MLTSMLRDFGATSRYLFDVRVFLSNALSCCNSTIPSINQHHEQEKQKPEYDDYIWEDEKASVTLLDFMTIGSIGKEATVFCCQIDELLSRRSNMIWHYTSKD